MISRKITLAVSAALAFVVTQVGAAPLAIPHNFTSGSTISSSEMNANFTAVKSEVDLKDSAIGANTTAIGANTTAIGANTTAIGANTTAIGANTTAIGANTTAIGANTTAITALQQGGNQAGTACAGNDGTDVMVRVGPLCVDKYEVSVWDAATSPTTQYGDGSDNYLCADNGSDCAASAANPIYARSQSGVAPSTYITWFQAQMACINAGKRLLTSAEWQAAAIGTSDPGDSTGGGGTCVTNGSLRDTGGGTACVSSFGAEDMVGNAAEWVADWFTPRASGGAISASTGINGDGYAHSASSTTPSLATRGGDIGDITAAGVYALYADKTASTVDANIGFRCAR